MRLSKLRRKLRRQLRRETDLHARTAIEQVLNDETSLEILNHRIETEVNPWSQQGLIRGDQDDWDFRTWLANAWDWFVANWPKILEIIIVIASLFMSERKYENS